MTLRWTGIKIYACLSMQTIKTVLVTISKDTPDISDIALSKFMDWAVANDMHCNTM